MTKRSNDIDIQFFGAVGTVTGSRYLVHAGGKRILVDCGLYQGVKTLRLRNWHPLPTDLEKIDAVVLTHAHLDHSGYLPAIVRDGYKGLIHCSPPTLDLARVLLPDSAYLLEEDARYARQGGFSKHNPPLPLYTQPDADRALERFSPLELGARLSVGEVEIELRGAGHILGAASVEVRSAGKSVLFSGDLGRDDDLLLHPPEAPGEHDAIVVESTYGDRCHRKDDPIERLAAILNETVARGGILLIPAFAVGRAQTILFCFHEVFARGLAKRVPVFLNSPMATRATKIFERWPAYHRLSPEQCRSIFSNVNFVESVDASRQVAARREPCIIVSASGMATGGRVLHHLRALLPDARNTVLLPGFQAPGTRGGALAAGAERVTIHGQPVPVRAKVQLLDVLSAHADQRGILAWLGSAKRAPRRVFVTHGEPVPADLMRVLVQQQLGIDAATPDYQDRLEV